jgi:hypothetical protein
MESFRKQRYFNDTPLLLYSTFFHTNVPQSQPNEQCS